ncbi:MAG TPA: hypothetical protein VLT86_05465 [Vicinamibacterales bacterium]|nr:hypothetical protein [Vicinamibacterales bacterium]
MTDGDSARPGLRRLPLRQNALIIGAAAAFALGPNDLLKTALIARAERTRGASPA